MPRRDLLHLGTPPSGTPSVPGAPAVHREPAAALVLAPGHGRPVVVR